MVNISFDGVVTKVERFVMLVSYMTLILIVSLETLRRMVTGEQFGWGPDVSMYAFVWLAWFAMSANLRSGKQLSFMTFREMMPKKVRKAFEILDYCIWLIVGLVVFVTSVEVVINDFRLGRHIFGTNIPMAAASLAVPAGWFFAMIRILQNMYRIVKSPDNEEEKDKNLIVS